MRRCQESSTRPLLVRFPVFTRKRSKRNVNILTCDIYNNRTQTTQQYVCSNFTKNYWFSKPTFWNRFITLRPRKKACTCCKVSIQKCGRTQFFQTTFSFSREVNRTSIYINFRNYPSFKSQQWKRCLTRRRGLVRGGEGGLFYYNLPNFKNFS